MTNVPNPAGLGPSDYVELTIDEFRHAYETFSAGLEGRLPLDPEFPESYIEVRMGVETLMPETPFARAWFAAGKVFDNLEKRLSFYARVARVMPLALDDHKYGQYVDRQAGSFHVALFAAVAAVGFNSRTTPKALAKAFAIEFRRCLASIEAVSSSKRH